MGVFSAGPLAAHAVDSRRLPQPELDRGDRPTFPRELPLQSEEPTCQDPAGQQVGSSGPAHRLPRSMATPIRGHVFFFTCARHGDDVVLVLVVCYSSAWKTDAVGSQSESITHLVYLCVCGGGAGGSYECQVASGPVAISQKGRRKVHSTALFFF